MTIRHLGAINHLDVVKRLWDEEQARNSRIRVVLLGSAALQLHRGMTESLAGRYFLNRCMHWTWPECEKAFGWSLEDWLVWGGYPGAAALAHDESLWRQYVTDSVVEAVLARPGRLWALEVKSGRGGKTPGLPAFRKRFPDEC